MKTPRINLIRIRKSLGMTQEELANKAEISRAYLSNLESGKYNPSLEVASKLAVLLEKSVEELFL